MKFRNTARPAVLVLTGVLVLSALSMVVIPDVAMAVETITLRSGNAPANQPDPNITMLTGTPGGALSPNPFTPADFAAACSGPNATVTVPISVWLQQLACDPLAQWIGIDCAELARLGALLPEVRHPDLLHRVGDALVLLVRRRQPG